MRLYFCLERLTTTHRHPQQPPFRFTDSHLKQHQIHQRHSTNQHHPHAQQHQPQQQQQPQTDAANNAAQPQQQQREHLAVIVPFRDRFEELLQFVPHMRTFLDDQRIPHRIYVINQVDRYRFNRASLINAGFLFACDAAHRSRDHRRCDYIAMHDVDLLPINAQLSYRYPADGQPFHVAAPELHPKYHYRTFVGGILLVGAEHFRRLNGMSNQYWGWGLEDDEFYLRIRDAGLAVQRPQNVSTGTANTFLHVHDRRHRKRDTVKCFDQREVTRKRDRRTGLATLRHSVVGVRNVTVDGSEVVVVNVRLECDKELTPWCDCDGADGAAAPAVAAAAASGTV